MADKTVEEKLGEEIVDILREPIIVDLISTRKLKDVKDGRSRRVAQILAIIAKHCVVEDENQELPNYPLSWRISSYALEIQQDMLDIGFKKIRRLNVNRV